MAGYILAPDVNAGWAGHAYIIRNGDPLYLFFLQGMSIDADLNNTEVRVMGTPNVLNKWSGMSISGTMDIFMSTNYMIDILYEYQQYGTPPTFNIKYTTYEPGSTIGRQTLAFYDCSFTTVPMVRGDATTDVLTGSYGFVATRFEPLERFDDPAAYGNIPYL